jgi:hypothetical protein
MKPPPLFKKWTNEDEVKLEEAQSDIVEMMHTALGHMVALKKKELLFAVHEMSQEEFDQLVAARSEATPAAEMGGGLEPSGNRTAERMITCPYWTENAVPRMYRSMLCQRGVQRGFKGITKGFRCYLYIII